MSIPLKPFSIDHLDQKRRVALLIWVAITIFCVLQSIVTHRYNNYLIFENTFRNLVHQQSFYAAYPLYHFDGNHYGPIFSVFIIPFAMLPNTVGFLVWNLFNCFVLFKAIETIPVKSHIPLYYIALPCLISASLSQQFNPAAAAFIILSYTQLNKQKGFWSAMLIMLGTFIKLYGIVGLAFFFFVKDKKHFILYLLFWALVMFALPMLFSSPSFIIHSYKEWYVSLVHKNASNIASPTIDISIMGFIRTLFIGHQIPNTVFLCIGCAIFSLPYLNFSAYKLRKFQLYILSSILLFPVLFSTGSEDCTYIIAIAGVGIWYVLSKQGILEQCLLGITLLFACNLPLVLFPSIADLHPSLYTMLSVPFFIVWLCVIYQACNKRIKRHYY